MAPERPTGAVGGSIDEGSDRSVDAAPKTLVNGWRWAETLQLLIILLAAGGVYFAAQQFRTSRDASVSAAVLARQQQRAYVLFENATLVSPITAGLPTAVNVYIKNTGQTPAKDVHWSARAYLLPNETKALPAYGVLGFGSQQLAPGVGSVTVTPVLDPTGEVHVMTARDIELLGLSRVHIVVIGRIEYTDVFLAGRANDVPNTVFCVANIADSFYPCATANQVN